jgi:ribosomal protein S18 acetylase RimI-like enzyme
MAALAGPDIISRMAALGEGRNMRLMELRHLPVEALQDLLDEEKARWLSLLHWDFTPSAELVVRYTAMQALEGSALMDGDHVVGYVYWVTDEHKGLVGDLFVRNGWRSPANENLLLGAALERLRRGAWIRRVEGQLMQLAARGPQVAPLGLRPRCYRRHFMIAPLDTIQSRRAFAGASGLRFVAWTPRLMDECAALIADVYQGHVDSEINDQYHSCHGARHFLENIVQYPGCGHFAAGCSWLALDSGGSVQGLALTTHVADRAGHVAQICLARRYQSGGAGYELMRRSLASLAEGGATEASLTVTASNERAVRLYEHFGFRAVYEFEALVWDRLWE